MAQQIREIENVIEGLGRLGYVADRALATAVYLLLKLEKPLLIEGPAGVGRTEAAKRSRKKKAISSAQVFFSSALYCNRFCTKKEPRCCWSMKLTERTRHLK